MGFFFNDTKKAEPKAAPKKGPAKGGVIPINSLRQMGCKACPRDKDDELRSPKMRPSGPQDARLYFLGAAPSSEEDRDDEHWADKAGKALGRAFGRLADDARFNFIQQCKGDQTAVEIECCRARIVADIEACKPDVIVTIGDQPFYWATEIKGGGVMPHRGTIFNAKIGNHVCHVVPVAFPNFAYKKSYRKSEHELTLEHDAKRVGALLKDASRTPWVATKPFDEGIEIITGQEMGDIEKLEKALAELAREPDVAVDYETNTLRPFVIAEPLIYCAAIGTFNRVVAFPLDHPDGWQTPGQKRRAWSALGAFLMHSGMKFAHNLAMELDWSLYFFGKAMLRQTEWGDTMAMAHTLDERGGTKSLEAQTIIHFGFNLKAQSRVDPVRLLEYPIREALRYNGMDSKWTHKLAHTLEPLVRAENWYEYERKVRLAPTLIATGCKGLPVDFKYANQINDKLEDELASITAKIRRTDEVRRYEDRYGRFSPGSPDDVLKLLRDVCQRPEVRVEDRNGVRYTTEAEQLGKIPKSEVPSASLTLEFREAEKLRGTYVIPTIDRKIVSHDDRIRSTYSSMVAETGRLNSQGPNVQNFPKRKHKYVRGMVYAPPGQWIAAFDYGQIEFRVVGMCSEDDNLVRYCWTDYDVHLFWAKRMVDEYPRIKDYIVETFEVDWDEKGIKTLRQEAKNGWVFPQFFGSATKSCAETLHLPERVAEDLAAEFWDEFKGVKKWQERTLQKYEKTNYVETLRGRKRRGALSKNQIINHPIQGTAFDIVGEAMDVLSEEADARDDENLQPNINVHDDLTFWLPDDGLEGYMKEIVEIMVKPRFDFINVPLLVEASLGRRWDEIDEIGKYRSDVIFSTPNPYR